MPHEIKVKLLHIKPWMVFACIYFIYEMILFSFCSPVVKHEIKEYQSTDIVAICDLKNSGDNIYNVEENETTVRILFDQGSCTNAIVFVLDEKQEEYTKIPFLVYNDTGDDEAYAVTYEYGCYALYYDSKGSEVTEIAINKEEAKCIKAIEFHQHDFKKSYVYRSFRGQVFKIVSMLLLVVTLATAGVWLKLAKKKSMIYRRRDCFEIVMVQGIFTGVLEIFIHYIDYPEIVDVLIFTGMICLLANMWVYAMLFIFEEGLEVAYIGVAIILGIVFMLIMPIYSIPDEPVHLWQSYAMSNRVLGIDTTGLIMMRKDDAFFPTMLYHIDDIQNRNDYYRQLFKPLINGEIVESTWYEPGLPKYAYVFATMGITLGRMLKCGAGTTLLIGRLFNLIISTIIIYFAIKKIPTGKMAMLVAALLPMFIHQGMSYSYDSMTNACAFWVVACTVFLLGNEKATLTKIEWVVFLLANIELSCIKGHAYILLALLSAMILLNRGIKNFSKVKEICIELGVVILLNFVWPLINTMRQIIGGTGDSGGIGVGSNEGYVTIAMIKENPLGIISMFYRTFRDMGGEYIDTTIGGKLGWLDVPIPKLFVYIIMLLLFLSSVKRTNEPVGYTFRARMGFAIIAIITIALIMAGMMFSWTPKDASYIEGVQGRYFLPILPLILLSIKTDKLQIEGKCDKHIVLAMTTIVGILIISVV